ncbi:YlcI/YnfO family protein [Geoalkalibacter subterraneus]|jgi:predicted transcriptional regulator|uniref:Prevent-host-death protein n=1 Tax=Geoalkalibacter subterraneus TaxID=483547 RepID=A0A0B5FGX9_9BACT|nr:YlcI/YnfO family protein [Geoalkalibacter subterraneus]AJF06608.1 prevent-host-death protein [Geoalkalibacter subterraneus]
MKTATLPPLRVDPELRREAESVLQNGETLSSFMEKSLRSSIEHRKMQQEFIARGLASRDEARKTGEYFAAKDVLDEMSDMLAQAEAKARK